MKKLLILASLALIGVACHKSDDDNNNNNNNNAPNPSGLLQSFISYFKLLFLHSNKM